MLVVMLQKMAALRCAAVMLVLVAVLRPSSGDLSTNPADRQRCDTLGGGYRPLHEHDGEWLIDVLGKDAPVQGGLVKRNVDSDYAGEKRAIFRTHLGKRRAFQRYLGNHRAYIGKRATEKSLFREDMSKRFSQMEKSLFRADLFKRFQFPVDPTTQFQFRGGLGKRCSTRLTIDGDYSPLHEYDVEWLSDQLAKGGPWRGGLGKRRVDTDDAYETQATFRADLGKRQTFRVQGKRAAFRAYTGQRASPPMELGKQALLWANLGKRFHLRGYPAKRFQLRRNLRERTPFRGDLPKRVPSRVNLGSRSAFRFDLGKRYSTRLVYGGNYSPLYDYDGEWLSDELAKGALFRGDLGKRNDDNEDAYETRAKFQADLGKRAPFSPDLSKRFQFWGYTGKRIPITGDFEKGIMFGKRGPCRKDLGKRSPSCVYLGKRYSTRLIRPRIFRPDTANTASMMFPQVIYTLTSLNVSSSYVMHANSTIYIYIYICKIPQKKKHPLNVCDKEKRQYFH